MKKIVFIITLILFLGISAGAQAETVGEKRKFYIDSSYDLTGREELNAVLVKITPRLYFYADENWWGITPQNEIYQALSDLEVEFQNRIYPLLTSIFGSEWTPGIDRDYRITILIHPMRKDAGGYFSSKDEYPRLQVSSSNEREMIYLNSEYIKMPYAKSYMAHEFMHLITFNQKDNTYNISEDTWLNEARAEYVSTLLGYDDVYEGSNLERRVQIFSETPFDSLIEWENKKADYGTVALFGQYLVDHYTLKILVDSLRSSKIGIESINYALEKNGFKENLSKIFEDWTIAVLINDCNFGPRYCYLNKNLSDFHVVPQTNFLPLVGKSTLTFADITKNWSGNWYKIIGGRGTLKFSFSGSSNTSFNAPYIVKNRAGNYIINFLFLDKSQRGEVYVSNFGTDTISLFVVPVIQNKNSSSSTSGPFYSFTWTASIVDRQDDPELINRLLSQIEYLKREIARVQAQINAIISAGSQRPRCQKIESNLYYGLRGSEEVRCLQEFLRLQGQNIYPEGLVTGYFGPLTKTAAIRFQQRYNLSPANGGVTGATKSKINELLSKPR